MSTSDPRLPNAAAQPEKLEGDGQDAYPTYRDGPASSHAETTHKPTDIDLPKSERTYASPMLIGLIAFAVVIVISIVWGALNLASTDAPSSTGETAPSAQTAPADGSAGPLLQSEGAETATEAGAGPGEPAPAPGAADVPGGATTDPAPKTP